VIRLVGSSVWWGNIFKFLNSLNKFLWNYKLNVHWSKNF
jgi:hypothetical protein